MPTELSGYPDLLNTTKGVETKEMARLRKIKRRLKNMKKRFDEMAKRVKELEEQRKRAEEAARMAEEQRASEAAKKKDSSFFSRICDAVVKAIPAVITAVTMFFVKGFFSFGKKGKDSFKASKA